MSRSKNRDTTTSYGDYNNRTRVPAVNATRSVRPMVLPRVLTFSPILLEDRRTFHPEGPYRAPQARYRSDTQLVIKGGSNVQKRSMGQVRQVRYSTPSAYVGFRRPAHVAICIRRKARREVLFALGVGGSGAVRPGKRTYTSGFRCN